LKNSDETRVVDTGKTVLTAHWKSVVDQKREPKGQKVEKLLELVVEHK